MANSLLDPITQSYIPLSPELKQTTGNMFVKLAGSPVTAMACQATSDMLMIYTLRKQLRTCLLPRTMRRQVQPDSVWTLNTASKQMFQRLGQVPQLMLAASFAAFVGLGFASWGMRSRRRKQKPCEKIPCGEELVPLKQMDDVKRTTNVSRGVPLAASVRNMKSHPLFAEDEQEDEDSEEERTFQIFRMCTAGQAQHPPEQVKHERQAAPVRNMKSHPLFAEDKQEDEDCEEVRTFQIFRMSTAGQAPHPFEQVNHERQVGFERSCTLGLEFGIHQKPLM